MKVKHFIALLLLFSLGMAACGKEEEEEPIPDPHEMLYDKWWYNEGNQGRGDHYFNSDGTCQMTIPPANGTWTWSVNDSLTVTMDSYPPMNLHFSFIKESTMEYWPTFEPEGNLYQFSTTKP